MELEPELGCGSEKERDRSQVSQGSQKRIHRREPAKPELPGLEIVKDRRGAWYVHPAISQYHAGNTLASI